MNKALNVVEENKWSVRRDMILGILVAVCITIGLICIAKVSLDGTRSVIGKTTLQPLKEVTDIVIKNESRFTTREEESVIILDEDDIYEGWGKAAARTILVSNYFKEDVGQITIEALWDESAAQSRCKYIQDHPKRRWFKPWIDDKEYVLKSVYALGRFCIRFTPEVSSEDEGRVIDKIKDIL